MMKYTTASIPDLSGTTAVVTGANGGLGLETAKALAARGAHVVMAVRDQDKAADAAAVIRAASPAPRWNSRPSIWRRSGRSRLPPRECWTGMSGSTSSSTTPA